MQSLYRPEHQSHWQWTQGMTKQKNLIAISIGILHRNFAEEKMIRTDPNLNFQNAKHEKHSENPNRNTTCIDSNISLNFEPNQQQNKYKRSISS